MLASRDFKDYILEMGLVGLVYVYCWSLIYSYHIQVQDEFD